jgi:hypothetical protein
MTKNYKLGILNAIKLLYDEIQLIRDKRDSTQVDKSKENYNSQILSHILSIQHLKEVISEEK